ncbi:MAG: UDP-N-acetylmuramate dehydrogenase [Oscillospiraceae bacterium]
MINQLKAIGCDVIKDAPLKQYTTFKIGGNCNYLIKPNTIEQLKQSIGLLKSEKMPYYILGNGSNVLISSNGVKKAVILMNNLDEIYINQDEIIVQAGAMLSAVCKKAKENSLAGMEFAYGIPGFVGGAIYMNAGAYGGEIKDILTECTVLTDNEIIILKNEDCDFSYRHSRFMNDDSIILSATFC